MSKIQDPPFQERWPLFSLTIKRIVKGWIICAIILGLVALGLMAFGGAWVQTDIQTTTLANGVQRTVTTTTVNQFTAFIVNQIGWGLYVSGLCLCLPLVFFLLRWAASRTHLNSEAEVKPEQ